MNEFVVMMGVLIFFCIIGIMLWDDDALIRLLLALLALGCFVSGFIMWGAA